MRMSCNGCRVLRKGCSEYCSIRPCLEWIKSPESQANATVFLAKFYGRAGLMNLINAGPEHLRPAIFRSLLYEACGRIVNPIYGSVGLLWSGSWQLCQAAVEAVLKGVPITPITSEVAASGRGPPLKPYDIRHVSKDESNSAASNQQQRVKTRSPVKKRSQSQTNPKQGNEDKEAENELVHVEPDSGHDDEGTNRSASHDSSLSHLTELATVAEEESKESESTVDTAEASILFRDEPESNRKRVDRTNEDGDAGVGLELTLGFEQVVVSSSRASHVVVPVKKRRIELMDCGLGLE